MANTQLGAVVRHIRQLRSWEAGRAGSDGELIAAFSARNDQAAFAGLVERYGPLVLNVCRRVLRQEQDAEDAFQATFLVLARKAGAIRKRESLGSWLHGVAYRVAMRARQQAARRRAREAQASTVAPGDPAWKAAWQEVQVVLDEEVQALPEKYRAAFVLCCLEGCPQAEVARRMGVKTGTVGSRLARARGLLQARLARRGVALSAVLAATALAAGRAPAVPSALAAAAVKSATLFARAGTVPAGTVATNVLSLAKGVQKTMFPTTIKTTALLLLTACAAALGLSAALHVYAGAGPVARPQQPPPGPPPAAGAPKAPAAAPQAAADAVEVSGQVLGPDDKPFAGARLFVMTPGVKKEALQVRATTGDDGRFRVALSPTDVERGANLVATAGDHGPDWIDLKQHKPSDEVTLRLVKDDVPVTGRVLDLEGQPVVGASVAIAWVHQVDLTPWLADPKEGQAKETKIVGPAALDGPAAVKTDKDGRFRLTGFGRDRVAHLQIRGEGIENIGVKVMARAGELRGLRLWGWPVYAPGSDFVVRPSKPIVGTVRDKKTGKPVSGIYVANFGQTGPASATTDEKGQYRIEGAAKSKEYFVVAGGLAYFRADKVPIADTQGLDPLTVDFELERGVVVKGRLTDKATGKPVRGRVSHVPLTDNPNLKDFTGPSFISGAETDPSQTKDDGSFAVVCVPGPGLLEVFADDADRYVEVSQEDYKSAAVRFVAEPQAIVRIEPDEKDEKSLRCDITLEPGRTLGGTVVGPDGKPLTGARAAGLHVRYQDDRPEQLKGDSFSVASLGSSEPRGLVFTHREKGLARVQVVPAGRTEPLTVRLEPTGALVGRLLDADGKPRAEVTIRASYHWYGQAVDGEGTRGPLPVGLRVHSFDNKWPELVNGQATTDKDGRFRITGLVPGLQYKLEAPGLQRDDLSVKPGKDNDLGDLK